MASRIITLELLEPKKHSGKYVVPATKSDRYPTILYIPRDWLDGETPTKISLTVEGK